MATGAEQKPLVMPVLLLLAAVPYAAAFYSSSGPVIELTPSNFESKIKSGGIWLVEFYAPWCGHCQSLKPAWEQAARALKGIVNVAAVDANEHKSLGGQYGVQGFPTIKLFYTIDGSIKTKDYNGGRSAKEIVSFAMDKARAYAFKLLGEKPPSDSGSRGGGAGAGGAGSCGGGGGGGRAAGGGGDSDFYKGTDVITLSDGNFDEEVMQSNDLWMVEFYAPWCGHCKALKPAWIEAAQELSGKVKVGAVDCTVHQSSCGQFGVRGYPTIKFFGSDKNADDYQGGRDSGSIVDFATRKWTEQQPPREVRELVDEAILETECVGFNEPGLEKAKAAQLCFFAFLPNILDTGASGRNSYLSILKDLASKYKSRPFSYLWVEGAKQEALEKSFDVGGFGYPALIAYNPKEQKFSTMKSAFETEHVISFVESIRKGLERVQTLQGGKLGVVETIQPWDGQDGKVEEVEEFSLDDIMNEEL